MTGIPQAMASKTAKPKPSKRLVKLNIKAPLYKAGKSSSANGPVNRIWSAKSYSSILPSTGVCYQKTGPLGPGEAPGFSFARGQKHEAHNPDYFVL
jgi:hypothetical protein